MPLFGKSQKSPAEVVKALKEAVNALERGEKKVEKVCSWKNDSFISITMQSIFYFFFHLNIFLSTPFLYF